MKRLSPVLVAVLALVGLAVAPVVSSPPAAASVKLPTGQVDSLVVDQAHGKVFMSGAKVAVANLSGALLGTIDGITAPGTMSLSADGSKLLVLDGHSIQVVDAASATVVDTVPLGDTICPEQLAPASGKVFFGYYSCSGPGYHADQLGAVDLASGVVTTGLLAKPWRDLAAIPGQPNALAGLFSDSLILIDTTGGLFPTATERTSVSSSDNVLDMKVAPDGTRIAVSRAGFGFTGFKAYSTTDLAELGSYPLTSPYGPQPQSVAIRADGMLAASYRDSDYSYLRIYKPGSSTPFVDHRFPYTWQIPGPIEFGAQFLYGVHEHGAGTSAWDLEVYTPGPKAKLTMTTSHTHYAWSSDVTLHVLLSSPTKSRKISIFAKREGGTERWIKSGYVNSAGQLNVTIRDMKINTTFRAAFTTDGVYDSASASRIVLIAGKVTLTSSSTARSGLYHLLPASPTPYLRASVYQSTSNGCTRVLGQHWEAGAWHAFDKICIRSRHSRGFNIAIQGFKRGDRIKVVAQYVSDRGNISSPRVTYYVRLT